MKMKSILISVLLCVSFVFLSSCQKGEPTRESQYKALMDFYNATGGDKWRKETRKNWGKEDLPFYKWAGVNVSIKQDSEKSDPANNVYTLVIDRYNTHEVDGKMPSSISHLTHLRLLRICGQRLSGRIPSSLGKLKNLEYLWFDGDELSGSVPSSLGELTKLKTLSMIHNNLSGRLPNALGNLENLEWLRFDNNKLKGPFPKFVFSLKKLKNLDLKKNNFSGEIPFERLEELPALETLYLQMNSFSGQLPDKMKDIYILLDSNCLSGEIPRSVIERKKTLSINYNMLWSDDPEVVAFLNRRCKGWQETQTISPKGVRVEKVTDDSVKVSWEPILFQFEEGYYLVSYGTESGNYSKEIKTESKKESELIIEGLPLGTDYYFAIQSYTAPHEMNRNELLSEFSNEVSVKL